MANAGWYPDPGGQPGMYRYWTGSAWSAVLSPDPSTPPPGQSLGGSPQPTQQPNWGAQAAGGWQPQRGAGWQPGAPQRRPVGWWVALGVIAVAVVVLAVYVVPNVGRWLGGGGGVTNPASNPTAAVCPPRSTELPTPIADPGDGRVHGGKLSYPTLGSPWGAPEGEYRVPFGRDAKTQTIMVEQNYNGAGSSWVASVLVAELVAGDGFFSPQQGSEIVARCIMGEFYGDAEVKRQDLANKALTVDGKDAWLLETHLTFDIAGLKTKGELAIIVIVATSVESSSIYYASIPDTVPQYVQPARDLMAALRVEG